MAVLHLQFDIDSGVHPELHEMLCSLGSRLAQVERLRQLAATGLVWERLRLQAYGRIEVPDLAAVPMPAPKDHASLSERADTLAARAVPQMDSTMARSAEREDFIDLGDPVDLSHPSGLDPRRVDDRPAGTHAAKYEVKLVETADWMVRGAALLLPGGNAPEVLPLDEIRSAVRELPVLTEVVGATELANSGTFAATAEDPSAAKTARSSPLPNECQIHELAPARKTATRSRLLRMKEKGLFKNE
jgi:hypothetical protein